VFFIKDPAPFAIPFPPSKAPLLKPSVGNYIKSLKPEPILWANESGLPKMAKFPIIGNITFLIPS
jgi:hypothetical protein